MTQCVLLKNPTAPGWILKCAKLGGVGGRKRERQKERARARERVILMIIMMMIIIKATPARASCV